MSPDLFMAILAMDSYNRGYNAGINLSPSATHIGSARIDSSLADTNASFFAQAYNWNARTIISYRGTDQAFPSWQNGTFGDIWNGWGVGGGSFIDPQAQLAVQFYRSLLAPGADPRSGNILLTGHSLGGGLAGFIGALYGKEAVFFDNMPFELAASAAYGVATLLDWLPWQAQMKTDIYGTATPWASDLTHLSGYAVANEVLSPLRLLQSTPITAIDSYGGLRSPVDLHSQALLAILMFARDAGTAEWQSIGKQLLDALFHSQVAVASGANSVAGKLRDDGEFVDILQTVLAYSAIDEGVRPFGDTGIRALFNDANELGSVFGAQDASTTLKTAAGALSKVLVQFAGQLAVGKVLGSSTIVPVTDGILSVAGDEQTLAVDFSDDLWSVGAPNGTAPQNIVGRQHLTDAVFATIAENIFAPGSSNIRTGMRWLWNDETSDADTITGSVDRDFIYGGDGNDTLLGGRGDDLVAGGDGDDRLNGGEDRDFLLGGGGEDTVFYPSNNGIGVQLTLTGVTDASGAFGERILQVESANEDTDRLVQVEKIELTDKPDTISVDKEALKVDVTIDMGFGALNSHKGAAVSSAKRITMFTAQSA